MTRRRTTYRARKPLTIGPSWAHYFRRYSASVSAAGARGGFTSHGFRVRVPLVGPLTINLTNRTWTWDNPGPGSVSGGWGDDPEPAPRRRPRG